jgi:hypothetical protein
MVSGLLKAMPNLHNWWNEFRKYHRNEKGVIVKESDHLMDATRYLVKSGRDRMIVRPQRPAAVTPSGSAPPSERSWMV